MNQRYFVGIVPALLATGLAWLGCSSGDTSPAASTSGSTTGPIDATTFVAQFCTTLGQCCSSVGKMAAPDQCQAFYGAWVEHLMYEETAGGACLDAIKSASAAAGFCDAVMGDKPLAANADSACESVFKPSGNVQPGGDCMSSKDCASSSEGEIYCMSGIDNGMSVGKCQVVKPGKAGDTPCVGMKDGNATSFIGQDGVPPSVGYFCDRGQGSACDAATKTCVALAAIGSDCTWSEVCVVGAFCDFPSSKCAAKGMVGAACNGFGSCVDTAFCDMKTSTCSAELAAGAMCQSFIECASGNCMNGACVGDAQNGGVVEQLLCGG
jgi:hypothetical protein